jgi:hypothetical protein
MSWVEAYCSLFQQAMPTLQAAYLRDQRQMTLQQLYQSVSKLV